MPIAVPHVEAISAAIRENGYAERVEAYRKGKSTYILQNNSIEHATIVIRNLLIFAGEHKLPVRLLSGELFPEVYDGLVPEASDAIRQGCDIRVITMCGASDLAHNKFYHAVIAGRSKDAVLTLGEPVESRQHFMLVGDKAYRVEDDHNTKRAYACFNDENAIMTAPLGCQFEKILRSRRSMTASENGG
jgi:hypothetical protein